VLTEDEMFKALSRGPEYVVDEIYVFALNSTFMCKWCKNKHDSQNPFKPGNSTVISNEITFDDLSQQQQQQHRGTGGLTTAGACAGANANAKNYYVFKPEVFVQYVKYEMDITQTPMLVGSRPEDVETCMAVIFNILQGLVSKLGGVETCSQNIDVTELTKLVNERACKGCKYKLQSTEIKDTLRRDFIWNLSQAKTGSISKRRACVLYFYIKVVDGLLLK
jgi:hypothetical protein